MHAAKLSKSDRLQRVRNALTKAVPGWLSTLQISQRARVLAVSTCVAELRKNGMRISCVRTGDVWRYRLES